MNKTIRRASELILMGLFLSAGIINTGCYDREELETQAFVTTLGLDKAPNNQVDCTMTFAVPKNPSSGGGGGGGGQPLAGSGPVTYRAHSVAEAMLLANANVERQVTMTHLTMIYFGEDLAKSGLQEQLQPLVRYREFRRTTLVAVTKGKAKDVMSAEKPMLDQSTGRLADSIAQVGTRTGLFPTTHLHEFLTALENPHMSPLLPVYSVNEAVKDDPKGQQGIKTENTSYQGGETSRSGGNPVEWLGAAVFKKDKLVGYLDGRESIYLRMLRGTLRTSKLDFPDLNVKNDPLSRVAIYTRKERNPTYSVQTGNTLNIHVNVPLDADLISSRVNYTSQPMTRRLEQQLDTQLGHDLEGVLRKLFNEQGADVIPVSQYIRSKFATDHEFTNYPWEQQLKTARVSVNVDVRIRRFGIQMAPIDMS